MIADPCLEASRRLAWAKFYAARADAHAAGMWAAELGIWLEHLVDGPLPGPLVQLLACVELAVPRADLRAVDRYVAHHPWRAEHEDVA